MVDSNIFYSGLAEISFQSNNVLSNGKKVNSSSFHLSFPAALVNTRSILVKYVLGIDLVIVMSDTQVLSMNTKGVCKKYCQDKQ